jgi:hypothetical protein
MWGRYQPQATGWDALAQIVGAIGQRNQERAQANALTNVDSALTQPQTDTRLNTAGAGQGLLSAGQQFNNAPQQFGIDQTGLLSGNRPAQAMPFQSALLSQQPSQTSPIQAAFQQSTTQQQTPFRQALSASQSAQPALQPSTQQPPTMQVNRDYRTNAEAMRDLAPKMKASIQDMVKAGYSAKEAYSIVNQKAQEIAGMRVKETADRYAAQADEELNQAFGSSDPRKILQAAAKHRSLANRYGFQPADMQLVAQAIKMGARDFQTVQENGENVTYAVTPDGQYTEVHRSKPGITEIQQAQLDSTRRAQDITARGQEIRSTGTRSTGGGNNAAQLLALYKDASETVSEATGETDVMGRPIMTRRVKNPELAQRLLPYINSIIPDVNGGQQQDVLQQQGNAQETELGYIQEAITRGVAPAKIAQGIKARANELINQGVDVDALLAAVGANSVAEQNPATPDVYDPDTGYQSGSFLDKTKKSGLTWVRDLMSDRR